MSLNTEPIQTQDTLHTCFDTFTATELTKTNLNLADQYSLNEFDPSFPFYSPSPAKTCFLGRKRESDTCSLCSNDLDDSSYIRCCRAGCKRSFCLKCLSEKGIFEANAKWSCFCCREVCSCCRRGGSELPPVNRTFTAFTFCQGWPVVEHSSVDLPKESLTCQEEKVSKSLSKRFTCANCGNVNTDGRQAVTCKNVLKTLVKLNKSLNYSINAAAKLKIILSPETETRAVNLKFCLDCVKTDLFSSKNFPETLFNKLFCPCYAEETEVKSSKEREESKFKPKLNFNSAFSLKPSDLLHALNSKNTETLEEMVVLVNGGVAVKLDLLIRSRKALINAISNHFQSDILIARLLEVEKSMTDVIKHFKT